MAYEREALQVAGATSVFTSIDALRLALIAARPATDSDPVLSRTGSELRASVAVS